MEPITVASVFVLTAVAGATELVRRIWKRDYEAATVISISALIGALAGVFLVDGLTVTSGIIAGLSASGLITTLQKTGSGASPEPTSVTRSTARR